MQTVLPKLWRNNGILVQNTDVFVAGIVLYSKGRHKSLTAEIFATPARNLSIFIKASLFYGYAKDENPYTLT